MATTYTTNYNLGKQENHADKFDMDVITDNADKIDAALTGLQSGIDGKQDALSTAQLAAVNSGITSADVAQITTNKNNILLLGEKYIDKSVANTAKTITLASASQYIITINAYAEYGVFLCYKYNNESSPRLYTLSKSSDFDQNVTVAAESNSNNISITPASSSVWYVVGGVRLN